MQNQFELGVRLGIMDGRLKALERGAKVLKIEIDDFKTWLRRGGILIFLWAVALISNLSTDTTARLAIAMIQAWTGH